MTQWVEEPGAGRARGLTGMARAWVEVLVRPRSFFRESVAPGDQAPGLTFAAAVVLVAVATRFWLVADAYPVLDGRPVVSAALWLLVAVVLVAPAAIHLTAAVQTVILIAAVPQRGGISETVQVICYATAPCLLAGIPDPRVTSLGALWGAGLYVLGLRIVHDVKLQVAVAVGLVPAIAIFGYGFGGVPALAAVFDAVVASLEQFVA